MNIAEYLASQNDIRHRLFSLLSMDDLVSCRKVCKSWKQAADHTEKTRKKIQVISDENNNFILCHAEFVLNLLPGYAKEPLEDSKYCSKELTIFSVYGTIAIDRFKSKVTMPRRRLFPSSKGKPMHNKVSIRFPEYSGVFYEVFTVENLPAGGDSNFDYYWKFPEGNTIKAVIVFCEDYDSYLYRAIDSVFRFIKSRQDEAAAFAGCICNEEDDGAMKYNVFLLIGGPNVDGASTILTSDCKTQQAINTRIKLFQEHLKPYHDSIILVFRCCERRQVSRCYNYRPNENVDAWEAEFLTKHFPKSEIVGCIGGGEFGREVGPHVEIMGKKSSAVDYYYSYSTCLLFLGFKNL